MGQLFARLIFALDQLEGILPEYIEFQNRHSGVSGLVEVASQVFSLRQT